MSAPAAATDAAAPAPRGVGHWLRAVGALVFWGSVQGVALLPQPGLAPGQGLYRPLIPPIAGFVLNLLVAAGFVWWFARRPAARRDPRRRATFRLRPTPAGAWPWVAVAGVGAAVAVTASLVVLPRYFALPSRDRLVDWVLDGYTRLPGGTLAFLVLVAVVAPLLEEFLFRGWLQGRLERRMRAWPAILVTAAVFTAAHGNESIGVLPRFGLAVAAGYAAWATRSIWPSVALHGLYNAGVTVGSSLLPRVLPAARPSAPFESWGDPERAALFYWARTPGVFWPAVLVLLLAAGVAAWALWQAGRAARDETTGHEARPADAGAVAGVGAAQ